MRLIKFKRLSAKHNYYKQLRWEHSELILRLGNYLQKSLERRIEELEIALEAAHKNELRDKQTIAKLQKQVNRVSVVFLFIKYNVGGKTENYKATTHHILEKFFLST